MIAICTGGAPHEKEMPRQTPPLRTRHGKESESESESVSRTGDDARAARSNATARLTKTKKSQKRRQRLRRRRQLRRQRSNVAAASVTARCHNRWRCGGGVEIGVSFFFSLEFPQNLPRLIVCGLPLSGFHALGHFCASRRLINE